MTRVRRVDVAVVAVAFFIGGWLGAHWSINKGEAAIRTVLNVVLVGVIIKLLFFS
jgi:uncharacterized membrane protein YfcA